MKLSRQLMALVIAFFSFASAHSAHACQIICMATNTIYNGNLGGLSGADAKCNAEYPNFKMARSVTILADVPSAGDLGNLLNAWANMAGYTNCGTWTLSTGTTGSYPAMTGSYFPQITVNTTNCGGSLPILCCNM